VLNAQANVPLVCHSSTPCGPVRAIQVRVHRPTAARLDLIYGVQGDIARLLVPPTSEPRRTDGLWQHTCFEVFLATGEGPAYYEFNFSPSTQWAAYRFDSYRKGMNPVVSLSWPRVYVDRDADRFTLSAALDLESLPDLTGTSLARLALTAVIEDTDHHIS